MIEFIDNVGVIEFFTVGRARNQCYGGGEYGRIKIGLGRVSKFPRGFRAFFCFQELGPVRQSTLDVFSFRFKVDYVFGEFCLFELELFIFGQSYRCFQSSISGWGA